MCDLCSWTHTFPFKLALHHKHMVIHARVHASCCLNFVTNSHDSGSAGTMRFLKFSLATLLRKQLCKAADSSCRSEMDTCGKAFIAEKTSQSAAARRHTYLPPELVELTARLHTYTPGLLPWFRSP